MVAGCLDHGKERPIDIFKYVVGFPEQAEIRDTPDVNTG